MQAKYLKYLFIKNTFLPVLIMFLLTSFTAHAKPAPFNVICQLAPDTYFLVEYDKTYSTKQLDYYSAGLNYKGFEAGSPEHCNIVEIKNDVIHMRCEDPNVTNGSTLKFPIPTQGVFFEMERLGDRYKKPEIYNLCRMM